MPLFTCDQHGRMHILLKATSLVEKDFQLYGPIVREETWLAAHARFHIAHMEQNRPTPETILTDNKEEFTQLFVSIFTVIYRGLLVAYTGFAEELRVPSDPRYSSVAIFEPGGQAIPFLGRLQLTRLLQAQMKANTLATTFSIQVLDKERAVQPHFSLVCQTREGKITAMEMTGDYDPTYAHDILQGLDLPIEDTLKEFRSAMLSSKSEEGHAQ